MPDWVAVVLLGFVEGLTEFLPVSSTGHLLLAQRWLPEQTDLFTIGIQCGAVLAVLLVFWKRVRDLALQWREPASRNYAMKLGLAFAVTAVGGVIADKLGFELKENAIRIAMATLIGGVLILLIERWLHRQTPQDEVTWAVAVAVGLAQLVAGVFPGTSRSGASILTALALGVRRPAATEFSFLLGIPTIFAASGYKLFSVLQKGGESVHWGMLGLGTLAAGISAFAVVRWLLRFVQTHTFNIFGWYRIVLGALILFLVR
jgi:undecaprenyl-diphosphatase